MISRVKPLAKKQLEELQIFAKENYRIDDLQLWDFNYIRERLSSEKYTLDEESLRAYFPLEKVLEGYFQIVKNLYGLNFVEVKDIEAWDPSVRLFKVFNEAKEHKGDIYFDPFSRDNKMAGAYAEECRFRFVKPDGTIQTPIASLLTNFRAPEPSTTALLTHENVVCLFHEFGHCLHMTLGTTTYPSMSGPWNMPYDVVEMPSQFLENFAWEKECLKLISSHYVTHEILPDELLDKLIESKKFLSGVDTIRQLYYATIDFKLHMISTPMYSEDVDYLSQTIFEKVHVLPSSEFDRSFNTFLHLFYHGYEVNYYGYKWSEALALDAFSKFKENGIFDRSTSNKFLKILEAGSSKDFMQMIKEFLERDPSNDALLEDIGFLKGKSIADKPLIFSAKTPVESVKVEQEVKVDAIVEKIKVVNNI